MGLSFDLEKQLIFYGSYHHNPVNIGIHVVCVPLILLTYLCFGTNTPPLLPLTHLLPTTLPPTLATISTTFFLLFFSTLDPFAAALLSPLLFTATSYFHSLTANPVTSSSTNLTATAIFTLSWLAQFIGHGVFEGRAPALLDNLVQAVLLAPCFVWLEVLFWCGYRPELQERVRKGVEKEIAKVKKEKGRKGNVAVDGVVYGSVEDKVDELAVKAM